MLHKALADKDIVSTHLVYSYVKTEKKHFARSNFEDGMLAAIHYT